jgi:hypothetical protein
MELTVTDLGVSLLTNQRYEETYPEVGVIFLS